MAGPEIGIAGGADLILIPERPVDLGGLMQEIDKIYKRQGYVNIAVAEGTKIKADEPVLLEAKEEIPVVKA